MNNEKRCFVCGDMSEFEMCSSCEDALEFEYQFVDIYEGQLVEDVLNGGFIEL